MPYSSKEECIARWGDDTCGDCGEYWYECDCPEDVAPYEQRNQQAIDLAVRYGGIDGDHHKAWVIDQMVRILAGERYEDVVREACAGEDGPDTFTWDCGTAP